MPLWRVFANHSTFSAAQKKAFAEDVTKIYIAVGLPPFYVNVIFIDTPEENYWIGGEAKSNFVRIVIEQIARALPDTSTPEGRAYRLNFMNRVNDTLRPHIIDRKELEWEHHIYETPRDLWRTQGLDPPPARSEEEKEWVRINAAKPWQKKEGGGLIEA